MVLDAADAAGTLIGKRNAPVAIKKDDSIVEYLDEMNNVGANLRVGREKRDLGIIQTRRHRYVNPTELLSTCSKICSGFIS
jgi:hypothetical protein